MEFVPSPILMDIEALKRRLPLGFPYLLIDRVVELGDEAVAQKCVTVNEPYFQGHFRPPFPSIMPGTMLLEGMAQTAGLLAGDGLWALAAVDKARFRRPVIPGDRITFRAHALRRRSGFLKAEVRAEVDGELAAEAILTLMRRPD